MHLTQGEVACSVNERMRLAVPALHMLPTSFWSFPQPFTHFVLVTSMCPRHIGKDRKSTTFYSTQNPSLPYSSLPFPSLHRVCCCAQEHAREQEKVQQSQPPHPSQAVVQQAVHSKTANRHLNAMEMIEWASTRHKREQIRQQQLEQQQAQALEQQRLQAQQGGIPGGNMQQPQPNAVPAVSKPPLHVGLAYHFCLSALLWIMWHAVLDA